MTRWLLPLATLLLTAQPVHASTPWNADDVHMALETASPRVACVIRHEIGGYNYDPYRNGAAGELGPAQLHPRGLLQDFWRLKFTDPHSPWQAVLYMEDAFARGLARHWSPVVRGLC